MTQATSSYGLGLSQVYFLSFWKNYKFLFHHLLLDIILHPGHAPLNFLEQILGLSHQEGNQKHTILV